MMIKPLVLAAATSIMMVTGMVRAETTKYPSEPVRIVSPFAAGGTNDYLARLSGKMLGDKLGGSFVVEQKTGAGGMIGSDLVAKSKPNGNTLLMGSISTHAIAPAVFRKPPFNARTDFTPISIVANVPLVLVVNAKSPYKTIDDLIAAAKAEPGVLTYGTPGNGAVPHLTSALLAHVTGIDLLHVPYRGESVALSDLMGGQITMAFANLPGAISLIKSGALRPLIVAGSQRASAIPEVPTATEAGIKDFQVDAWYGLMGPANMPDEIVQQIAQTIREGVSQPEIVELIRGQGAEPVGNTPEEFKTSLFQEQDKWADVVKKIGIEQL